MFGPSRSRLNGGRSFGRAARSWVHGRGGSVRLEIKAPPKGGGFTPIAPLYRVEHARLSERRIGVSDPHGAYPTGELHVVLDTVSTHKTPAVRAWLEQNPRITFHFTPTSASWMNQVETWFGILTRQAIRRGSFRSVKELVARIEAFTQTWNSGASPFAWVRTADEILAKAVRKRPAISESGH
jgi:hypothetical protein